MEGEEPKIQRGVAEVNGVWEDEEERRALRLMFDFPEAPSGNSRTELQGSRANLKL